VDAVFVTATDTGVGKTVLSAALLAAIAASGRRVRAHKPVVTGLQEPPGQWPADHEVLASIAGMSADAVAPARYGLAASPHLASLHAGEALDYGDVLSRARAALLEAARIRAAVVMEGVGGLLAPLTEERGIRDLIAALGIPVVIAARPGLGTINHTLLTLEAARARGVDVRAVVLTPWPHEPTALAQSNRKTIARLGRVVVDVLESVECCAPAALARAGGALPWRGWLGCVTPYAGSRANAEVVARRGDGAPARTAARTATLSAATS
jgi:dethiobiotin synthetase